MTLKDITIKKVELNNIRMFENFKREFFKGYNFIQGDNGTGKTTILLCIGSILGFIQAKSLLRDGSDKGSINLIIGIDDNQYVIHKGLIRKGDSVKTDLCYVKDEQGKHEQDVTGLKEYVINLLNIKDSKSVKSESEIYRYAIFSPQGEMTKILSTQKKDIDERNQTLRKTFRTEEYKNARDMTKELVIQINNKRAYLKGKSENIEKRRESFEKESRDVSKINDENENLNLEKEKYKEDLERLNNLELTKEKDRNKYNDANIYVKIIGEKDIDKDVGRINDYIIKERREKDNIIGDIEIYRKKISEINSEIENNINVIEELKKEEEQLEKNRNELFTQNVSEDDINIIEELKKEEEQLEKSRNQLFTQKALKNERIKEYDSVKDKIACYTCGQKVDKNLIEFNIEINRKELEDVNGQIGRYDDNLKSIKQKIEAKLQIIEENNDENEKYNKLIEENNDENEKYNKLIKRHEEKEKIIEETIDKLNKDLSDKKIELQKRDELLKLHGSHSASYDKLSEELKEISINITNKETEYNEIDKKITGNIATINQKNKTIKDIRVEIENNEEDIKKYNFLEEYSNFLKGFIFATDKIEKHIFTKMRNKFNRYMQELSFSIMNKRNIKIEINEDFTPIVKRNDVLADMEGISGGEQASIAFSYRVVLNMVVSDLVGINLPLIFDEPTYGFSQAKLTNLRNSIKELRFNQLKNKQVIIVSHEEKFRDIADYSFKLISVNENTSIVEEYDLDKRTDE